MSCGRPSRQCQLSSELLTEPRIPLEWVAAFSFQERIDLASILLLQSCIMIMSYLPFWFVSLIRYLENLERHGGTSFGTETLLKGHFRLDWIVLPMFAFSVFFWDLTFSPVTPEKSGK